MRAVLGGVMAAVAVTASAAAETAWRRFDFPEAGFSVEAPATLRRASEEAGPGGQQMVAYLADVDGVRFIVATLDGRTMPADAWESDPDVMAGWVVQGATSGARVVSNDSFAVPGGAGREFRSVKDGLSMRVRVYVRRPWVVQVGASATEDQAARLEGPELARLFQSMALANRQAI